MTTDIITTTGTWTAPTRVFLVDVKAWGGGGSGGRQVVDSSSRCAGGGGGAYALKNNIAVAPGLVYTATVGPGGAVKTVNGAGNPGGDTWFKTALTVLAKEGLGGTNAQSGDTTGVGGTTAASIGDTKFAGGSTSSGDNNTATSAGGGGAGDAANGGTVSAGTYLTGGTAGTAGGGVGGIGARTNPEVATAGATKSAGGGGALTGNSGAGARGELQLTYLAAPDVVLRDETNVGTTTVTLNGEVIEDEGETITERGFVYGTTSQPAPNGATPAASGYTTQVTQSGSFGEGTFTSDRTGLTANTIYYVRAFAKNADGGYNYSDEQMFVTAPATKFFGQKIDRLVRFNKVKAYLKFTGSNNAFNLKATIRGHKRYTSGGAAGAEDTTQAGDVLYTSAVVAASTLSTSAYVAVTFTFSTPIDLAELNEDLQLTYQKYTGFWVFIEPEDLGTFSLPTMAYSLSVVDTDNIDFTADEFMALGTVHGTYIYMNLASIETIQTIPVVALPASQVNIDFQIVSHTVETTDGKKTRGNYTINLNFSQTDNDVGVFANNCKIRINSLAVNEDDITINVTGTPGGPYTNISQSNVGPAISADSTFGPSNIEIIINRFLNDGDVITLLWSITSALNVITFNSATATFRDHSRTRQMSLQLIQPTQEDKWLSELLYTNSFNTSSGEVKMVRADNGFMYFLDTNAVHSIDGGIDAGTYGTVAANILKFPSFFDIADGADYRGNLYIAINHRPTDFDEVPTEPLNNFGSDCGVYIWDRLTSVARMSDYIPIQGAKSIRKIYVAPTGAIRVIVVASDGLVQIREFTGSIFQTIKELGLGAAPQFTDSLTTVNDKTTWLAPDGNFYCHGKAGTSEEPLAQIARIRAPLTETSAGLAQNIVAGAILYESIPSTGTTGYRGDRQGITLSYSISSPLVKKLYPFDVNPVNSVDQKPEQGDIFTGVIALPYASRVQNMTIICSQGTLTGTTVQATLKIYFNGSATPWATKTVTRNDIKKGWVYIPINESNINSIQVEVEYPTDLALTDTRDFHPSYAVVEYSEVGRKEVK